MVRPTPKFKSHEQKQLLVDLKEVFDANSLGIVLLDALERRAAEEIFSRNAQGARGTRLSSLQKVELVGQITGWFFASEQVAYQVVKEMDRACQKERHIVASIPEDQAGERVGSYRAIAFKRERAKLVWALSRDERPKVRVLASRVINDFFREAADIEKAQEIVERGEGDEVELARTLKAQAERLAEATVQVTEMQSKLSQFDEERVRLLAEIGSKERMLKQASEARGELEGQVTRLKDTLSDVEVRELEAEEAQRREREARAKIDELTGKLRRLEKLAGASGALTDAQGELESLASKNEELHRVLDRAEQDHKRELTSRDKERRRMQSEIDELRQELHQARKQLAEREEGTRSSWIVERTNGIAILLDQANLAATASISYGRKVNFAALYEELRAARPVHAAVAFVVDNGGAAFDAFVDVLKRAGWDVRIKRPKKFADGSTKADWDMGIAMEAVELASRVQTLVLVSGDGDFLPLVKHLKRKSVRVEVASFPEGLAADLAQGADAVLRLDARALE
ncbi:MAG: NYN domain-containing protein [Deltaproteobacteria bacterium]|nr:NYN domain-containing protein [Deltaproteobacteria bacterium]